MCEPTDEELTTRGREGMSMLVERYHRYVRTIIIRRVSDAVVSDELIQEVFLRAVRCIANFQNRGPGSFKAWLSQIAMNVIGEYFRRRGRDHHSVDDDHADPDSGPRDPMIDLMDEAMETLNPADQDILRRQYCQQQSYQEIADDYGVTVHVVKECLRIAKLNLRNAIDRIRREQNSTADT